MNHVLRVDSGSSKALAAVVDQAGRVLEVGRGGNSHSTYAPRQELRSRYDVPSPRA